MSDSATRRGDGATEGAAAAEALLAADAQVSKAIRRIGRAVDMRSKKVARETGLTLPQIVILRGVRELGEVTTAVLSRHCDLSAATVVTILEKLENRGMVTRRRSHRDRRIVHTALTEAGAAVLSSAPALLPDRFTRGFAKLSPAEQRRVAEAFATVADLMDPDRTALEASEDLAEIG